MTIQQNRIIPNDLEQPQCLRKVDQIRSPGFQFCNTRQINNNDFVQFRLLWSTPIGDIQWECSHTVLSNQFGDEGSMYEDEEEEYTEEEEVVMDENYESPVRIEVKEEKPLTAGDVFKAFGKLGSMLGETMAADPNEGNAPAPKKNTGFFGIGGETVQLDGNDARGYRQEKIEPDEF